MKIILLLILSLILLNGCIKETKEELKIINETSNSYSIPLQTEEGAKLFAKEWIKNHTVMREGCNKCDIASIHQSRISKNWNVALTCSCDLNFDENITDFSFGCKGAPECSGDGGTTVINIKINCSSNKDCYTWNKNATCSKNYKCSYVEPLPCPKPCIKIK